MDVERRWNNRERGKPKDPEETFIRTSCSATYSTSTRLVLRSATSGKVSRLSCGVAMKNRLNLSHLLAI
jgi:hypothetical protein